MQWRQRSGRCVSGLFVRTTEARLKPKRTGRGTHRAPNSKPQIPSSKSQLPNPRQPRAPNLELERYPDRTAPEPEVAKRKINAVVVVAVERPKVTEIATHAN